MKCLEFAEKESKIFDYTLDHNPYLPNQHDTFSYLATKRAQTRLYRFILEAEDDILNNYIDDINKLYNMICECIKTHKHQINRKPSENLSWLLNDVYNLRNIMSFRTEQSFYRIYSPLDHMRNCMLEDDDESPVDLMEFNRITNRFLIN